MQDITLHIGGGGLSAKSADGSHEIRVGSRLHLQAAGHNGDLPDGTDATDGTELRRARIQMSGRFLRDFNWAAEADFADNDVSIKDFRIGTNPIEDFFHWPTINPSDPIITSN